VTSTARTLRGALQQVIETVPDAGVVHNRVRMISSWEDWLDRFRQDIGGAKRLRGWMITRSSAAGFVSLVGQTSNPFAFGEQARPYVFQLTGLNGFQDSSESELEFEDLVEAVMDELDAQTTLGIPGAMVGGVGPSLLTTFDLRTFGSVLCDYCEILVPVVVVRSVP
jgi:hypothetical protein